MSATAKLAYLPQATDISHEVCGEIHQSAMKETTFIAQAIQCLQKVNNGKYIITFNTKRIATGHLWRIDFYYNA